MPPATPPTQSHTRYERARAFRHGELVCGRVDLRVRDSGRVGLTAHERREIVVRFLGRIAPGFGRELEGLVRRGGGVARRAAERMQAIELVVSHLEMGDLPIVGHVQPPQRRHGEIHEIEFALRELPDERIGGASPAARVSSPRIVQARPGGARDDA